MGPGPTGQTPTGRSAPFSHRSVSGNSLDRPDRVETTMCLVRYVLYLFRQGTLGRILHELIYIIAAEIFFCCYP
jgi:hypothetical protein